MTLAEQDNLCAAHTEFLTRHTANTSSNASPRKPSIRNRKAVNYYKPNGGDVPQVSRAVPPQYPAEPFNLTATDQIPIPSFSSYAILHHGVALLRPWLVGRTNGQWGCNAYCQTLFAKRVGNRVRTIPLVYKHSTTLMDADGNPISGIFTGATCARPGDILSMYCGRDPPEPTMIVAPQYSDTHCR
jgi:hypothetical protein